MGYCENCGCRTSMGICSNCEEENYILTFQADAIDFPLSDDFIRKAKEQEKAQHKRLKKRKEQDR